MGRTQRRAVAALRRSQQCGACERNCPQKAASIRPAMIGAPLVKIADSWEEIAAWIGVDAETLSEIEKDVNRLETITDRFSKIGSAAR